MPVGPYKTFSDCITALTNKGKSPDAAKNICGAMEKQSQASLTEKFTDASGSKLYVKAFLIDDTVNLNQWGVTKDSIQKHINTFIGKPLVLTENYDHPAVPDTERIGHWLAYQEVFRVGTIIDIVPKSNPLTGGTAYHAIIEITNDNLKQSLRNNSVPLYVSPAIAEPAISKTGVITPASAISEWQGVHLAIVDQPAFGIKKAVISEQCGGDQEGCLLQLRKAHVAKYGPQNCGFCVKNALSKLEILHTAKLNQSHTSQFQNSTANMRKEHLSTLETIPNAVTNNENEVTSQQQPSQPQSQEQSPQPATTLINKAPLSGIPSTTNITDLVQINQKLTQENELLRIRLQEATQTNETLGERIGALELQGRRKDIERIITADVIKDDKQRLEKIKYFTATQIPLDQIEELYNGLKVTLRKASLNTSAGRGGRVPYYSSNSAFGSGSIISSNPPGENVAEDDGLTPLQRQLAVMEGGI